MPVPSILFLFVYQLLVWFLLGSRSFPPACNLYLFLFVCQSFLHASFHLSVVSTRFYSFTNRFCLCLFHVLVFTGASSHTVKFNIRRGRTSWKKFQILGPTLSERKSTQKCSHKIFWKFATNFSCTFAYIFRTPSYMSTSRELLLFYVVSSDNILLGTIKLL